MISIVACRDGMQLWSERTSGLMFMVELWCEQISPCSTILASCLNPAFRTHRSCKPRSTSRRRSSLTCSRNSDWTVEGFNILQLRCSKFYMVRFRYCSLLLMPDLQWKYVCFPNAGTLRAAYLASLAFTNGLLLEGDCHPNRCRANKREYSHLQLDEEARFDRESV